MKRSLILTVAVASLAFACSAGGRLGGEAREQADAGPAPVSAEEQARAADLLVGARSALEAGDAERARSLSAEVLARYPRTASAVPALWIAARSSFELSAFEAAAAHAERYAAVAEPDAAAEAESLAAEARAALAEPTVDAPVLGVILPQSGSRVLERYGELVLQGVRIAAEAYEAEFGEAVELLIVDDGADPRQAARLVSQLERRGVVGIVGPVLGAQIAAGGRSNQNLVLVSPTDTDDVQGAANAYTLNAGDVAGAQAVARYAAEAGIRRAAVMYPRMDAFIRKADAFRQVFESLGGEVVRHVPYDSANTTFKDQLERILDAKGPEPYGIEMGDSIVWLRGPENADGVPFEPFALFAPAPPRLVRQIAPQIEFYGVDSAGVQVLGDEAWMAPEVRRVVGGRALEGVIAATPRDPALGDAYADPGFTRRYEERYRRTLDNPLPALGHDAALLLLASMPERRFTARAVARRVALTEGLLGVTGILSVYDGRVVRRPHIVQMRNGRPVLAPSPMLYVAPRPRPPADTSGIAGPR